MACADEPPHAAEALERRSLFDPRGRATRLDSSYDLAALEEDLGRKPAAVVLARHRETVGAGVTNHDVPHGLERHRVLTEVVRAFAHGAHDAHRPSLPARGR